jgi:hypothetical protein
LLESSEQIAERSRINRILRARVLDGAGVRRWLRGTLRLC